MVMQLNPTKGRKGSPAIWIYPDRDNSATSVLDVTVKLKFHHDGFMTESTPSYNEGWNIEVDPQIPYNRYVSRFGDDQSFYPFLDYDGFRGGEFQKKVGWCIKKETLLEWQQQTLSKLGFSNSEIADVNYTYGRMLLDRLYKDRYFAVYPQDTTIVDSSVGLDVSPRPETKYRLWLYFRPVPNEVALPEPALQPVVRKGLTVLELAYLTDRELPRSAKEQARHMVAVSTGGEVHETLRKENPAV
jgi:hypothetical protein